MVKITRKEFPSSLDDWRDAEELFCVGDTGLLKRPCVSIIGTRTPTSEGFKRAATVAHTLIGHGYCIVSGLAAGIDAMAHDTALHYGGKTIAVLGTPMDRVYPAITSLTRSRIEKEGLVVSQFPVGTKTFKSNFPKRNRLMAALGSLTIVIEASETSGTRHQVRTAIDLGRYVAIPASLAESKFPWVEEALRSERVYVLNGLNDLMKFLLPP